jgi:uncharacterized protein
VRFLDTNVFIRFLTGDDAAKAAASRALFEAMDRGEEDLFSSEAIVAECIYVLTSKRHYNLARAEAAERLRPALAVRGLHMSEKAVVLASLDVFIDYPALDFADALVAAHARAEGSGEVMSYDADIANVPGIHRFEPEPV